MTDYLEKCFWKVAVRILEAGYGTECIGDEPECFACQATNTMKFLRKHIELLE